MVVASRALLVSTAQLAAKQAWWIVQTVERGDAISGSAR